MRYTSTIPQNIFIYGYSHGGSSFEQLMCLDTTIVSLFFKKKKKMREKRNIKKKKREKKKEETYIINQLIIGVLHIFHVFQKGYMVE